MLKQEEFDSIEDLHPYLRDSENDYTEGCLHYLGDTMQLEYARHQWLKKGWLLNVMYERGNWCYVAYKMPSEKDIAFAKNSTCQDRDLWLDAEQVYNSFMDHDYTSHNQALREGLKYLGTW